MKKIAPILILSLILFSSESLSQSKTVDKEEYLTDQSGNTYKTVKIGSNVWMAQNLNTDKFNNGQSIQKAKNINEWKTASEKKKPVWCYLNFDDKNAALYGKYYNWYAATIKNVLLLRAGMFLIHKSG